MSRHLWIALPAYTGQVHIATMRSLLAATLELADRGVRVTLDEECGNGLIADARGLMVARFLASDATDMLFVDHDVVFSPAAVLRLLDAPLDVRAGVYPSRSDPVSYAVRWTPEKPFLVADPSHGFLEVAGVPGGFLMISRAAAEQMTAHFADLTFYCKHAPNKTICGLFEPYWIRGTQHDGETCDVKLGEDFSFCQRWRDLGGQVWVDPELAFGHVGFKTFEGKLGDWLRNRMKAAA